MKTAIIISNGSLIGVDSEIQKWSKRNFVICADGSADKILEMGITPDLVIGDLDSISENTMKILKKRNTKFSIFPSKKDKSDFELAIDYALKNEFDDLIIFGIFGRRIDHFYSNIQLLAKVQSENPQLKIKVIEQKGDMFFLTGELAISGEQDNEVSIIPITDLEGVETEGLEYSLKNESLSFGTTRGVSNTMKGHKAVIRIKKGIAMVIHNKK